MAEELIHSLHAIVECHHLTKHKFYQLWNEGLLTKEQLQEYSRQYYFLEASFPQYLSLIHSKCGANDLATRRVLVKNLYEEEVEVTPHVELWRQFEEGLGVPRENQTNAHMLPETEATISMLKQICSDQSIEEGLAAMFAYEAMLPEVSQRKIEGLKKHYGINDEKTLEFFTTHMVADAKHSDEWVKLFYKKREEELKEKRTLIEGAALKACQALNLFLDGVMKAYCNSDKVPMSSSPVIGVY